MRSSEYFSALKKISSDYEWICSKDMFWDLYKYIYKYKYLKIEWFALCTLYNEYGSVVSAHTSQSSSKWLSLFAMIVIYNGEDDDSYKN